MKNETKLTVTSLELDIAGDALEYFGNHYDALIQDLKHAKCPTLLEDVEYTKRALLSLRQKVTAAQDELLGEEFK